MAAPVQSPGLLTKAAYAEHRGVSASYISKLIREGRLAPPALLPNGRVNTILADQMLGASAPADDVELPGVRSDGPNYSVERARREAAQAELAEIELQRRRGESLSVAQVERQVFEKDRRIRDAILAAAETVAPKAHAAPNAQTAADVIRSAMSAALGEVAAQFEAEAREAPEDFEGES